MATDTEALEQPQTSPLGFALGFGSGTPPAEIPLGSGQILRVVCLLVQECL